MELTKMPETKFNPETATLGELREKRNALLNAIQFNNSWIFAVSQQVTTNAFEIQQKESNFEESPAFGSYNATLRAMRQRTKAIDRHIAEIKEAMDELQVIEQYWWDLMFEEFEIRYRKIGDKHFDLEGNRRYCNCVDCEKATEKKTKLKNGEIYFVCYEHEVYLIANSEIEVTKAIADLTKEEYLEG